MKILSYNINGIRAAIKKGFIDWLKLENPDVICLQEIKAMESQFDVKLFDQLGYKSFWFPAEKKGYSGVAILSKIDVKNVKLGIGNDLYDNEGRVLQINFEKLSIISLYLPSGTNISRLGYKFDFMDQFQLYIDNLKKNIRIWLYVVIIIFVIKVSISMTLLEIKMFQVFCLKNVCG